MAYPISDVPRRIVYSGSAGVGPYAFTFEVLAATDIAVYKNGTLLTLTTDYTVSINTGTGTGTVTLVVAATGSDQITLVGDRAIERTSDFVTGGDLFANTLNTELDSLTIFAQQVDEKADRAIKAPVTDPTTINMTLPAQATRANKILGFNASGNPTQTSNTLVAIDAATTAINEIAAAPSGNAAGISFLQAGSGAVVRTAQSKMRDVVSVKDFGAVGDGVADDTVAIQAAANYARANGYKLTGPAGTCKITSTIVLLCDCDLSTMTWEANALNVKPVIRVGPISGGGSSPDLVISKDIKLPKVRNTAKTTTGWNAGWGSGIELAHVYESRIEVPWIEGFKVGLDCGGYDYGFAYNEVRVGRIYNNEIGTLLRPKAAAGWANENIFYNGRYVMDTAEGVVTAARYIKLAPFDVTNAGTSWPNNNVFHKPSIEEQGPTYAVEIAGAFNWFHNPRFEGNNDVLMVGHSSSTVTFENQFIGGYQISSIDIVTTGVVSFSGIWNSRGTVLSGTDSVINLQNAGSSTNPVLRVFDASTTPFGKGASAGDYCFQLTSAGMAGKTAATSAASPRVSVDFTNAEQVHRLGTDKNVHRKLLGGVAATYALNDAGSAYAGYRLDANELDLNTYSGADIRVGGAVYPAADNTKSSATASNRWSVVYAATPAIATSDAREKQQIRQLNDAERRVAARLKGLLVAFKFNDSVEQKGDGARIHFGVVAQEVIEAFKAEGLDATKYAMLCHDKWSAMPEVLDEDGSVVRSAREAGDRYGVRYEELMAFIIAAL
jgi:hypothetical protein